MRLNVMRTRFAEGTGRRRRGVDMLRQANKAFAPDRVVVWRESIYGGVNATAMGRMSESNVAGVHVKLLAGRDERARERERERERERGKGRRIGWALVVSVHRVSSITSSARSLLEPADHAPRHLDTPSDANSPTRRSTQLALRQSLITSSSVHTQTECLTHQHGVFCVVHLHLDSFLPFHSISTPLESHFWRRSCVHVCMRSLVRQYIGQVSVSILLHSTAVHLFSLSLSLSFSMPKCVLASMPRMLSLLPTFCRRKMAKCIRVACAGHGSTLLTCSLFVIRPSHTSSSPSLPLSLSRFLPMTHLPTSLGGYGAREVGEGGTRGAD
ncbi:unnamed protein product [Protopolystoma xenopodis]|uniref:Uncharacterized protein n=1 Tax=Protopolystoma xenopodis TaxID=117903 RepID=A0A3S4ZYT8_9PLAT|nr:unnamed protein product [Protopolystoma xenopodis]